MLRERGLLPESYITDCTLTDIVPYIFLFYPPYVAILRCTSIISLSKENVEQIIDISFMHLVVSSE